MDLYRNVTDLMLSNIQELDLPTNLFDDITLDDNINNLFCQYINHSDNQEVIINPEDDPIKNPYKFLKHSYNEMLESLKNNTTMEELHSIQRYFYGKTSQALERHFRNMNERNNNKTSGSSIISSNVGYCKQGNTHGTKPHWATG